MADPSLSSADMSTNCTRCKNPARTGIKCIRCGKVSHKSCLKILKTAKFIDDDTVICCTETDDQLSIPGKSLHISVSDASTDTNLSTTESLDKARISYLEEIIRLKDLIISNQSIAIRSLNEQIILLKNSKSVLCSPPPTHKATSQQSNINVKPVATTSTNSLISDKAVSNAIHNARALNTCNKIINLEDDKIKVPTTRPKTRTRSILIGSQESTSNCPFKAAITSAPDRPYEYHVTNLDVNTDVDILSGYLKSFSPNIIVEKLSSKNPLKYSSFKLTVPSNESSSILDSNVWPCGVVLNRFFPSKSSQRVASMQKSAACNILKS